MIKICEITDVFANKINLFIVNNKKFLVIKKNDKFYILDNICLHKGAPLEKGVLHESEIECPWHGCKWSFENGKSKHNMMKIKTYEYEQIDKSLYIKDV